MTRFTWIDRLYLNGKERGSGLLQNESANTKEITNTAEYLSRDYEEGHFVNVVQSPY
jgi:hypothetical protein